MKRKTAGKIVWSMIGATLIATTIGYFWLVRIFAFEAKSEGVALFSNSKLCVRGEIKNKCVQERLPVRLLFSRNKTVLIPMSGFPRRSGDVFFQYPEKELVITNQDVVFVVRKDGRISTIWVPGYEIYAAMQKRLGGVTAR